MRQKAGRTFTPFVETFTLEEISKGIDQALAETK